MQSPLPVGPGAPFGSYQSEIYVAGMTADIKPIFTTNLSDLEEAAAEVLSEAARQHLLDWAGGAAAVRANAEALSAWRIVPRMFIDRSERDLSTTVLGVTMPAPVILGPVGGQAMAHPDGEIATARAAAGLDLTYVHSSLASSRSRRSPWPRPTARGGSDWTGRTGRPRPRAAHPRAGNRVHPPPALSPAARAGLGAARGDPHGLGRADRPRRHPERAGRAMAVDRGLDGIVVSNERGRRGPGVAGTIDVLPQIADAVGGKLAVLFGSGVRTGTDVYRALALGPRLSSSAARTCTAWRSRRGRRSAHAPNAPRRARDHPHHRRCRAPPRPRRERARPRRARPDAARAGHRAGCAGPRAWRAGRCGRGAPAVAAAPAGSRQLPATGAVPRWQPAPLASRP
jgi:hypothetical protein